MNVVLAILRRRQGEMQLLLFEQRPTHYVDRFIEPWVSDCGNLDDNHFAGNGVGFNPFAITQAHQDMDSSGCHSDIAGQDFMLIQAVNTGSFKDVLCLLAVFFAHRLGRRVMPPQGK